MITHPYIVAWNRHSPANYVAAILEQAKREAAPPRAICQRGAVWCTVDEVDNELARDCWEFVRWNYGRDMAGELPRGLSRLAHPRA